MDVVLIFNGLGNQMSQYALYLSKKQRSPSTRFIFLRKSRNVHNGYELEKVFGIREERTFLNSLLYFFYLFLSYKKYPIISRPVIRLFHRFGLTVRYENDNYNFQPDVLQRSAGIRFFVGGWHSDRYFRDVESRITGVFQFDMSKIGEANLNMLGKIRSCNSVSVHIRRGDFLDSANFQKFGAVCTLNYFVTAIERISRQTANPHFFFFTNDHAWVREHFTGDNFTVVDLNSGKDSWKDMLLMSQCNHNIASNGSFSWWAAYLNSNPAKTVIVPDQFVAGKNFEDIYPESWIRLTDY